MRTPDIKTGKCILNAITFCFIFSLTFIFVFSATAQVAGQLPVNLKTFKARAEVNNRVKIFWTTAYEKDNAYFDIERSFDAVNFTSVGKVAGLNNNGILTDYIFYDNQALTGISFYRLKQVDTDLTFTYSPVERISNSETTNSVDIYPNPAPSGSFKINLLKSIEGNIDVLVYDQAGRLLLKQQYRNDNSITVKHQLPSGVYTVLITGKEFAESLKLSIL